MQNIDFEVGDNTGGMVPLLWFVDISNVDWDNFPESENGIITDNVVLVEGAEWNYITFVPETLSLSEDEEINKHGHYYKARVNGTLAKDSAVLSYALSLLRHKKLLLCLQDNNGNYKLVGTQGEWMEAGRSMDSDSGTSGRNGYKISFTGTPLTESVFYLGDFSGVATDTSGIYDFTFDFTYE